MKAKDLRIGNLIHYHNVDPNDERKEWDEVLEIGIDDLCILTKIKDNPAHKPIYLSKKWMKKLGFKKQGTVTFLEVSYSRYDLGRYSLYTLDKKNYIYAVGIHDLCEIQFVHQLQNLYFALTGEELTKK